MTQQMKLEKIQMGVSFLPFYLPKNRNPLAILIELESLLGENVSLECHFQGSPLP
jgi:hypothetical protein